MKPNADRAGMARRVWRRVSLAVAALALMAAPAVAGDRALIDLLGFSSDSRYLAFEEFGIQDGSGFPYANIYLIDLSTDKWAGGSPFRTLLQVEDGTVAAARIAARQQAATALYQLDITQPLLVAAMIADGEGGDGQSLVFGRPGYMPGEVRSQHKLTLKMFPADTPEPCEENFGEKAKGFSLTLSEGKDATLIHKDEGPLPASRGCVTTYRIYAVVLPVDAEVAMGAAIISVYPHGFEGPDRRFIAVPLTVPGP